jgi:hypothetical protein
LVRVVRVIDTYALCWRHTLKNSLRKNITTRAGRRRHTASNNNTDMAQLNDRNKHKHTHKTITTTRHNSRTTRTPHSALRTRTGRMPRSAQAEPPGEVLLRAAHRAAAHDALRPRSGRGELVLLPYHIAFQYHTMPYASTSDHVAGSMRVLVATSLTHVRTQPRHVTHTRTYAFAHKCVIVIRCEL